MAHQSTTKKNTKTTAQICLQVLAAAFFAPFLATAQSSNLVTGPMVTVQTDGTRPDGQVNIATQNAGPIQFFINNSRVAYFDGTTGAFIPTSLTYPALPNNTWFRSRNAANSADVNLLKVDSLYNDTWLNAYASSDFINLSMGESPEWIFGNDVAYFTGASASLRSLTSDGADTGLLTLTAAGAAEITRGSYFSMYGNEAASIGGTLRFVTGAVPTGAFDFYFSNVAALFRIFNSSGLLLMSINHSGDLISDATNGGDIIIARSGKTLSLQEGTPASACMGVATPNGTTPVAVSTTCAVTGSRIFYTRSGAVTNMGSISTTTAPSGTGFSFASTGGSDTLASSVVWMIIKEAA